ncbi:deaminated glutathione amidase isoform X3 [Brienomyrus brachyistius]|uniref:deaminated glutathione amidase isoform X3 n=1 Tax=Brienomyrus brachyistius TaxID=42636 RepID=UPI0020B18E7B|nr:deaminated glutathione amidase isoform X3 [Brienomyrus brachyistius]
MLLFRTILQPRALYLRYQSSWGFCLIRKCRMSSVPLAAICQVTCTPDKEANFAACMRLVEQAKEGGASMVFLPEGFDYIGSNQEETLKLSESLQGNTISRYTQLARKLGIWLSLGGFHERGEDWETDRRIYNSHIIINDTGSIVSVYRKGHLFDVELTGRGVSLKESSFTIPGHSLMPPVQSPVGKVGLGVCYDLRFPELSLALLRHGAEILTYPSAFTVATGAAHWEERGVFVDKPVSCVPIVDPWGEVLGDCGATEPGLALVEIDLQKLRDTRRNMPLQQHRRDAEFYCSLD